MKKKYEKPQIYIEKFELAQHIAKCSLEFNNAKDPKECYADSNLDGYDFHVFMKGTEGCDMPVNSEEEYCNWTGNAQWGATFNS